MTRRTALLLLLGSSLIGQAKYSLEMALAVVEGWNIPGSVVRRLHNPGALVFSGQPGAIRSDLGYAKFETDEAGWQAFRRDLSVKKQRGLSTIPQLVAVRTPRPKEQQRVIAILHSWGLL